MEKNMGALAIILVVLCLIVGYTTGYVMSPEKVETITNTEIVEVPTTVTETITEQVEVISTDTQPLLDSAIADFLEEVEDNRTLQYCGKHIRKNRYDEDQILVRDVEEEYSISYEDDGYTVAFEVELKYLDKDVEEKCYVDYEVSAYYEDGEDVEISIA